MHKNIKSSQRLIGIPVAIALCAGLSFAQTPYSFAKTNGGGR